MGEIDTLKKAKKKAKKKQSKKTSREKATKLSANSQTVSPVTFAINAATPFGGSDSFLHKNTKKTCKKSKFRGFLKLMFSNHHH
jgi:hypothetical protein